MRILLTNDDGFFSPGLRALHDAVRDLGETFIVAPDREQSAASHSISLNRPLRIHEVEPGQFSVDGTPTDCVYLALNHIFQDRPPDLVISGINKGANLGDDVTYSGTVAAAIEATILDVPAFAMSLASRPPFDFGPAARFARSLAVEVAKRGLPKLCLLNVNVPGGVTSSRYRLTRQGKRTYGNKVVEATDPRGRRYYWIGGTEQQHEDIPGSDCNAVFDEKLISITPVNLDLTHYPMLEALRAWSIEGFEPLP